MKSLNRTRTRKSVASWVILGLFLPALLLSCAPGTILNWNQVDSAAVTASRAGGEKFNAIRVATFGPHAEQIYGYFLYRDGIDVVTGGGASIDRLGKITLGDVSADYARIVQRNMSNPRALVTREIIRGDAIVGYTITDIKLDVDLWDINPAGKGPTIVLRLDYKDRRNIDGGGGDSGEINAGR